MRQKHGLTDGSRRNDEVHQEDSVEVTPFLVLPELLYTPRNFHKGARQEAQVISAPNN